MSLAMRWALFLAWLKRLFAPQAAFFVAGYEGYGGATITRRVDGSGAEWIACCTRGPDGYFGFSAFKNGQYMPLSPRVSGRGSIDDDGVWIAWEGSTKHQGTLPGFVPKSADTSALEAQIDALAQRVDTLEDIILHLPPTITGYPLYVPAQPGMPIEGGEIQLADGKGGVWAIDCRDGNLRFIHDGVVVERWPK